MSQMRKFHSPKLKYPFRRAGRSPNERVNSLSSKSSVNQEYMEAFRTKSYIEMWNKVQGQLGSTSISRPSSSTSLNTHLSESLLEPRQETLADMIEGMNLHYLLIDYFKASLEAYRICELLLQSIHQTRANYRKIKRVIKLSRSIHNCGDYSSDDDQCQVIFGELAAFASLKNPLSIISPEQFGDTRDGYMMLLHRLTSKHRRLKRNAKFSRTWKKIAGIGLIMSHSALLILLLIFAFHSIVGIVAAPALLACSMGVCTKKLKAAWRGLKKKLLGRLGEQLDVAAKGVYILINDFDTMSRMVKRLHDEVEHRKAVADICVKNGRYEILKEVVREFRVHESSFLEQLEELEEHIYLCFLTINKSRGLVIQEIMMGH